MVSGYPTINVLMSGFVVVVAVVAMFGRGKGLAWARYAFGITAVCDLFLLFGEEDFYPQAIALFALAHICWLMRGVGAQYRRRNLIFVTVGVPLIPFAEGRLWISASIYALCLYAHLMAAIMGYRAKTVGKNALYGALLFVACDICVALRNLFDWAANFWILAWLFYAPSLICLAVSAYYKGNGELRMENGE